MAAACSSERSAARDQPGTTTPAAALEIDQSPIASLVVGERAGEFGQNVNAAASFPIAAPRLTAIARVGPTSGTVTFNWIRVPAEGDPVRLFSHKVEVEPGEVAYSTGISPGVLAGGVYRVEARMENDREVAGFVIEAPDGGDQPAGRAAPGASITGPPVAGPSGALASSPPFAEKSAANFAVLSFDNPDTHASAVDLGLVFRVNQPITAEVRVSMNDRDLAGRVALLPGASPPEIRIVVDPCGLGSDLPNSRVDFSVRFSPISANLALSDRDAWYGGGAVVPAAKSTPILLGLDRTRPVISTFNTSRRDGDRVKSGDKIGVNVIAQDLKVAGSTWQTGVKVLRLRANDVEVATAAGPRVPPACDESKRQLTLQLDEQNERVYKVPANPDPIIKLCALAEDYATPPNVSLLECATYTTGAGNNVRKWTGSIDWTIDGVTVRHSERLSVTLADDGEGNLTGTMTGDDPFVTMPGVPCAMTMVRPGKISVKLAGRYTPARNVMSLRMTERNYEQGLYTIACGPDPGPHKYGGGGPIGQPVLEQLLSNLTVAADGSIRSSNQGPLSPATISAGSLRVDLALRRTQ